MARALGVIPARFASTRFPGKPLAPLGDGTLLQEVWSRARQARRLERLIVATEDERIVDACRRFGAEVAMTSPDHASGSDRVAEVLRGLLDGWDVVVNVQGDEPMVTGTSLDRLVALFDDPDAPAIATLAEPITSADELFDPNVVKVVTTAAGRALYFSRAPIPYHRGDQTALRTDFRAALAGRGLHGYRRHQGIYAYRPDALLALTAMPPSALERDEGLEQLRALEAGMTIAVVDSDWRSIAVDTPEDLARAAARMEVRP